MQNMLSSTVTGFDCDRGYLDSFCLASTSGPKGVATPEGEHSCSKCHVTPVCQGCNDQAPIVALVLVPIGEE